MWFSTFNQIYKLIIIVEDNIGSTTFVVFCDNGEKVVGASITNLALLNHSKLNDQQKLFTVVLVTKSLKSGELSFRVLNCRNIDDPPKLPLNLK
ncbi:hypothetical protein SCA6_007500 [Theobroma cacao]